MRGRAYYNTISAWTATSALAGLGVLRATACTVASDLVGGEALACTSASLDLFEFSEFKIGCNFKMDQVWQAWVELCHAQFKQ